MADIKQEVEAVLFAAGKMVPLPDLRRLLNRQSKTIEQAIEDLKKDYKEHGSALMIVDEGDGWKLTVREAFLPTVQSINPHTELSKSILETLAVIAWKQPVLQADVIKVRTNKAYDHIAELEKLGFITKDRHGRSYALRVSQKFMDYFDLPDDSAIKDLFKGFHDIEVKVQEKADDFDKEIPEQDRQEIESHTDQDMENIADHEVQEKLGLKTFDDELPPVDFPGHDNEVHVYTDTAGKAVPVDPESEDQGSEKASDEDVKDADDGSDAGEDDSGEVKSGSDDTSVESSDDSALEREESEAEKAKRLAEELLKEDKKPEEEEKPKRVLHPELEAVVAGEPDIPPTRRPQEPRESEKEEVEETSPDEGADSEDDADEDSKEDSAQDEEESGGSEDQEASDASNPVESDSDEPKPAEEFPGQFSSGDDVPEGKEDKEHSDAGSEKDD